MKIELTRREIELLLILAEEATKGKFSFDDGTIVTEEEDALIKKLKQSLEKK
jgi:hypothetical protein